MNGLMIEELAQVVEQEHRHAALAQSAQRAQRESGSRVNLARRLLRRLLPNAPSQADDQERVAPQWVPTGPVSPSLCPGIRREAR